MPALAPTVSLRNSAAMPVLGLGTSPMRGHEASNAVRTALQTGYRLIDTAENYHNEDAVGRGLRESGLPRAEVFLTTKLNRRWHSVEGVRQAFHGSIDRLGVDYIDLFMVHWPNPAQDRYVDALRGLAALLDDNAIRAIGVSNFKPAHLERVFDETGIVPDVNQIQLSPYTSRSDVRAFNADHGIVTESWSPIGAGNSSLRSNATLAAVAADHGKTTTQVVLRWHVQLGLVAIPKSSHPGRIAENLDIFDFELSQDEMAMITSLDHGAAQITDSDHFGH